jgi:murein DD-endopeptidase MepM/ murein hydrolase activator NlpD
MPGVGLANPGGTPASAPPKITSIACKTECSGVAYARTGSVLVIEGSALRTARTVTFLGSRSRRGDEVSVAPLKVSAKSITVRVPRRAPKTGPLTVTNGDGAASKPSARVIKIENVKTRQVHRGGAGPGLELAVTGKKVFFDGERRPTVSFVVRDPAPVKVIVEVIRVADAVSVARVDQGLIPPNEQRSYSWDGLAVDGSVVPDGRYEFRVYAENAAGARASSSQAAPGAKPAAASPDSFVLLGHKFPIRGAHNYGEFAATYGGGREHQGQDVFAKCGTPLVAARGGTVKIKQTQSRAGHYVVIDGEQTDVDYIYMHLRDPALVDKGARVHTGQLIGYVGDTGRATGCHLHFELWSGPGWYTGGSPFDPLPLLKAWDRHS